MELELRISKIIFSLYFIIGIACPAVLGQEKGKAKTPRVLTDTNKLEESSLNLPLNLKKTTDHEVKINGKQIDYKATVGTIPVWDDKGKAVAGLFYVYYKKKATKDVDERPLLYSFNGGPGSGNVWMNIGFTGPKRLKISDEGYPVQPYGMENNPYSVLDAADIVYISPVNTAFSRITDKEVSREKFFGEEQDIKYLAEAIGTFTSRFSRWNSPKFLLGESYGTTRVAGLSLALQETQWLYLNGVILVSATDLGIDRKGPIKDASLLPYYAATAWYHSALSSEYEDKDLGEFLPEVEEFTIDKYIPALSRGGNLSEEKKKTIASKVSEYSGISKNEVLQNNLIIDRSFFWKELLRDRGYTVGRLDSRYLGMDKSNGGTEPDYNAEITSWNHSFAPAINTYLRDDLKFETDLKYYMFGPVHPWEERTKDFSHPNNSAGMDLSKAMRVDPGLHLMVLGGYFDGATDYFNSKYNMWQIDQNGRLEDRMEFHGFESGHMMYLRRDDLKKGNELLRGFIKNSIPKEGEPVKYEDARKEN